MGGALVVCIGNSLVGDDGAGLAVFERLTELGVPPTTRLRNLGLGGIDLLDQFSGEDLLVVVDGVQLGAEPGTVHQLDWQQLPAMAWRPVSGHGIGIREAIAVSRRLDPKRTPKKIYLVGIEGRCFDLLGAPLSKEVRLAVEPAARMVLALVSRQSALPSYPS